MKKNKLTKKYFCTIYEDMAKLRRKDPIQFNVSFNDWKRLKQKHL